ncbi:putative wall-associated receptor kinase, galacturonan-binding domain-containing protein [Helianthus anomalus]
MRLLILLSVVAITSLAPATSQDILACEMSCGSLNITFPFGSREGCYYNANFQIICDRSSREPYITFPLNKCLHFFYSVDINECEVPNHGCVHKCRYL